MIAIFSCSFNSNFSLTASILVSKQNLHDARERDWLKVKNINFNKLTENAINPSSSKNAKEILDSSLLLKSWIPMALLDFSTCTGFTQNQKDLARYFGVKSETIGRLLNELEVAGFLVRDEHNQLKKTHQDIRVPAPRSSKSIRAFQSIIDDLKSDPCTTVYQVQFQIIPLLKQND